MKTNGLIEIILYVNDMNAQVAFYRAAFGLDVAYPAGLSDYSNEFWVTLNTGPCVLALHGGGQKLIRSNGERCNESVNRRRVITAARFESQIKIEQPPVDGLELSDCKISTLPRILLGLK